MLPDTFSYCSPFRNLARASGPHAFPSNPEALKFVENGRDNLNASYLSSSMNGLLGPDYESNRNLDVGTRFGQRLRELRRTHSMTQIDMAVMLGIDRSYISEVERGKKGISLVTLEIIALGFRLHLADLLRDI